MKTVSRSNVSLIDNMGTDLTVVNAARVSFDKSSGWDKCCIGGTVTIGCMDCTGKQIFEHDKKLIAYLAKHGHWSPFAHTSIQVRVSAPIFVARQLVKHQVGLVWNEVSRRYVDDEPTFFIPNVWRKRAENVKQGSSEETFYPRTQTRRCPDPWYSEEWDTEDLCAVIAEFYEHLLKEGVAPEQARMVLPLNTMTEWYWTGSLHAFARVCKQRLDQHAQAETFDVAVQIAEICEDLFPVSWGALMGNA